MTQSSDRKPVLNSTNILIGLMVLLVGIMSLSAIEGATASARAQTAIDEAQSAMDEAHKAQADLTLHSATQNGSLTNINSGLNTLKQYRGTDKSDQQDFRDEVKAEIKDLRTEIQGLHNLMLQGHFQPRPES